MLVHMVEEPLSVPIAKLFQVDEHSVIGLTGCNEEAIPAVRRYIHEQKRKKEFTSRAVLLSKLLKDDNPKNAAVILVEVTEKATRYASTSIRSLWKPTIETVKERIRVDVAPEGAPLPIGFYEDYIKPEGDPKQQVIDCICGASRLYQRIVNNKIYGFEMTPKGCSPFTENIDIDEIRFRDINEEFRWKEWISPEELAAIPLEKAQ